MSSFRDDRKDASPLGLLWRIFKRQAQDSKCVYYTCLVASVLTSGILLEAHSDVTHSISEQILSFGSEMYALTPAFFITVIALFPSFSKATKKTLFIRMDGSQSLTAEPMAAAFLEQFVFMVLLPVTLYLWKEATIWYCDLNNTGLSDDSKFWLCMFVAIHVFGSLVLIYEIYNSLRLLYLMVLQEYFERPD